MLPPFIVSITRLHRETATILREADRSDRPIFVTQYAYVTAVLMPRRMYERLLRAAEKGAATKGIALGEGAADPGAPERGPVEQAGSGASVPSPLESPLAVFGPLPPRTRFLTRQGVSVDADLAAFLMEEGEEVRPILEHWGEGPEDPDDDEDEYGDRVGR